MEQFTPPDATVNHWFSYEELNHRLVTFSYNGTDASSKPCQVNISEKKLGGQAIQNWNFIHLLLAPITMHDRINDASDPYWQMFLILKNITN